LNERRISVVVEGPPTAVLADEVVLVTLVVVVVLVIRVVDEPADEVGLLGSPGVTGAVAEAGVVAGSGALCAAAR
jgi:hypothetical protein